MEVVSSNNSKRSGLDLGLRVRVHETRELRIGCVELDPAITIIVEIKSETACLACFG